jgi:hypothetical protein
MAVLGQGRSCSHGSKRAESGQSRLETEGSEAGLGGKIEARWSAGLCGPCPARVNVSFTERLSLAGQDGECDSERKDFT